MERIENVKITKVSLNTKDHCCLTFKIVVEGAGIGVVLGGYSIGHNFSGSGCSEEKSFDATGDGLIAIMKIMDTVGVDAWEDLVGCYARIKVGGLGSCVTCIGNIIKDKWFDMKEFFESVEKKGERQ